jgi:hypothetical protein
LDSLPSRISTNGPRSRVVEGYVGNGKLGMGLKRADIAEWTVVEADRTEPRYLREKPGISSHPVLTKVCALLWSFASNIFLKRRKPQSMFRNISKLIEVFGTEYYSLYIGRLYPITQELPNK